ncbi:MAG: hypothetical protein ICV66_05245 [Chitinophagaceae bacterium]|nr:hypothetical protein [Chitinophagaceae bacterium]
MVPELRKAYNQNFTQEKYQAFLQELHSYYPGQLEFRVAETPVFVPNDFTRKLISTCEDIIDIIFASDYYQKSDKAIPKDLWVPNQDDHPHFICFDFGVCKNEYGEIEPQLIEMQGFPSLFTYEVLYTEVSAKHFDLPYNYSDYLNGFDKESYLKLLRQIIIGDSDPGNVILLEVFPHMQKTRIDFYCAGKYLGIKTVDLNDIIKEGRKLYYNNDGKRTEIKRIYNRLIFDDLLQQSREVQEKGKILQEELDVEWIPHPNWFYRISKYSLPFIKHPYVPDTRFLNELTAIPEHLENYVVKPLFSFAGQGVIIDVRKEDIEKIKDSENWIIQRKVDYAAVIETPDEAAKVEIRIFYFWKKDAPRPIATNNLARLSKGKMIGVRYNKDREWVGSSYALFEK